MHTRHFILTRETKGALLYTEVQSNGHPTKGTPDEMFTTLYMRKSACDAAKNWPNTLKLTIEMADAPTGKLPNLASIA
jgi:hypothetical protein